MPWQGPFIVDNHDGASYTLNNLVTGRQQKVHVSRLKEFTCSTGIPPIDVARRDSHAYIVEKIISHTGKPGRPASMLFRVRWLGYGPSDDTNEKLTALKNNAVLHAYLRTQGLDRLLPAGFRDATAAPQPTSDKHHRQR
jgi:hypothetical protein